MKYFKIRLFLPLALFFLTQCGHKPRRAETAFYHWRTRFTWSVPTEHYVQQCQMQTLYLRILDIDWLAKAAFAEPVAALSLADSLPSSVQPIPVIFLTNRTFERADMAQIPFLARLTASELPTWAAQASQIQFDCDWTAGTKAKYFAFLEQCKPYFPSARISATIRLHQVKYVSQTGVPPVERGMLMAYNTGNLDDPDAQNTILELPMLRSYLGRLSAYPLALDVALPVFSWGVLLRDGRPIRLLYPLDSFDFQAQTARDLFSNNSNTALFELKRNAYFHAQYLYAGDAIRLESVPLHTLQTAAAMLAPLIRNDSLSVTFFQLDSASMRRFSATDLRGIVQAFR